MKKMMLQTYNVLIAVNAMLWIPLAVTAQDCPPTQSQIFSGNELRINALDATGCLTEPSFFNSKGGLDQQYRGNDTVPIAGIWEMTYWIGGITADTRQIRVASRDHGRHCNFRPGPLDEQGALVPGHDSAWNRVWSVSFYDLWQHRYDWESDGQIDQPIAAIFSWPGKGNPHFTGYTGLTLPELTAPFYDRNGDGIYRPEEGDYPHPEQLTPGTLAGHITWSLSNTMGFEPDDPYYQPVPFELAHTVWAMPCNDNNLLNNTIFFSRDILLKGAVAYDSVFFGQWDYPAVGNASMVGIGSAPDQSTTYYYKLTDVSEPPLGADEYENNNPATATSFLNYPMNSMSVMYSPASGTPPLIATYPTRPEDHYFYLKGLWRDGSPQIFNGQVQQFAYSGDISLSDSWTMNNYPPIFGKRLSLSSIYLAHIAPGERRHIDQAWSFHRKPGANHLQNVSYLLERVDTLRQLWNNGWLSCSTEHCLPEQAFCIWPGDANNNGIVNQYDIFPIASAWNNTGMPRESAPVLWMPQTGENWEYNYNNTLDYKYIDTNGDGIINFRDNNIVKYHYGKRRQHAQPEAPMVSDLPGFYFKEIGPANPDMMLPNQTLLLRLQLDTLADLRAAGGVFEWDTAYWSMNTNVLTSATEAPINSHDYQHGKTAFAIGQTQGNSLNPTNYGLIRLQYKPSNLTAPDTTYIRFSDVKGIYSDGSPYPIGARNLRVILLPENVNVNMAVTDALPLSCFPNPANETVYIITPDIQAPADVLVFDLHGRALLRSPVEHGTTALGVTDLPSGTYIIRLSDGYRIWRQRVVIMREGRG